MASGYVRTWRSNECRADSSRRVLWVARVANNQIDLRQNTWRYAQPGCGGSPVGDAFQTYGRLTFALTESAGGWRIHRARLAESPGAGRNVVWGVTGTFPGWRLCVLNDGSTGTAEALAARLAGAPAADCFVDQTYPGHPPPAPMQAGTGAAPYAGLWGAPDDECRLTPPEGRASPATKALRHAVYRTVGDDPFTLLTRAGTLEYTNVDCMGNGRWVGYSPVASVLQPSRLLSPTTAYNAFVENTGFSLLAPMFNKGVLVLQADGSSCRVATGSTDSAALPDDQALALAQGIDANPTRRCASQRIDPAGVDGL